MVRIEFRKLVDVRKNAQFQEFGIAVDRDLTGLLFKESVAVSLAVISHENELLWFAAAFGTSRAYECLTSEDFQNVQIGFSIEPFFERGALDRARRKTILQKTQL